MKTATPWLKPLLATLIAAAGLAFAQVNITMNTVQIFGTIDPAKVTDYTEYMAAANLYDGLVDVDETGAIVPLLADSWEVSDDAKQFTFTLKEGATFHDGSPVTANDVVYSVQRLLTIDQGPSYLVRDVLDVDGVQALNDRTVQFTLSEIFSPFLTTVPLMFVVNEEVVEANAVDGDWGQEYLNNNAAGAGPYMLDGWTRGSSMTVKRYEDWHMGWHEGAIDQVRWLVTNDEATVRSLAAAGDLHMTSQYQSNETYDALANSGNFRVVEEPTATGFTLKLNTKVAPTDDVHVRRAIACAMDYETIREFIFPSDPMAGPLPPSFGDAVLDTIEVAEYDLDCAREEMAQSKYAGQNNIPITHLYVANTPFEEEIALMFDAVFTELGFDVTLMAEPWNLITEMATDVNTTPNVSQIFFGPTYPSADSMLFTQYHSDAAGTWASMEWLQDEQVDALIDQARRTADVDEQNELYQQAQARIMELQPNAFLGLQTVRHAMDNCLEGFRYVPMQSFDYNFSQYSWTCN